MKGFDPAMLGAETTKKTPSRVDDALASKGRGNDSLIAHLSPREAAILKALGGSGKINPETGLLEFDDTDDGGDSGSGNGADAGSAGTGGRGDSDSEGNSGSTAGEVGAGLSEGDQPESDAFSVGSQEDQDVPGTSPMGTYSAGIGSYDIGGPRGEIGSIAEGARSYMASAQNVINSAVKTYDDFMESIHPSIKDAAKGYALTGSPLGALLGAGVGQAVRGGMAMSEMSDEDRAAAIASINESSKSPISNGNGIDISEAVGETADIAEPATTPVSTGRIVTRPAYRFNRQMVGLSAKNIYPERV